MPRKTIGYRCECKLCIRKKHSCNKVYPTYSGAYNHESVCPMNLRVKHCATCEHYKKYMDKDAQLIEECSLSIVDLEISPKEYHCLWWELSEYRKQFLTPDQKEWLDEEENRYVKLRGR